MLRQRQHGRPRNSKKNSRVVLGPAEYQELKRRLYVQQKGRCAYCGRVKSLHLHHAAGRGLGGWRRDDLDPRNVLSCMDCHPEADRHRDSKFGDVNE